MEMNDLLETLVETNIKSLQYLQVFSELFKFRLDKNNYQVVRVSNRLC